MHPPISYAALWRFKVIYRVSQVSWDWVLLTWISSVPLSASARLCLGGWEFDRSGWATWWNTEIKVNPTQPRSQLTWDTLYYVSKNLHPPYSHETLVLLWKSEIATFEPLLCFIRNWRMRPRSLAAFQKTIWRQFFGLTVGPWGHLLSSGVPKVSLIFYGRLSHLESLSE